MRLVKSFVMLLMIVLSWNAHAVTITDQKFKGPMAFYVMWGEFTVESKDVIVAFLKAHPEELNLMVHSPGGVANDIVEIMSAVNDHGKVRVIITEGNACLSACALMASAAMEVYGKVYYHAVFNDMPPERWAELSYFERKMTEVRLELINYNLGRILEDVIGIPKLLVRSIVIEDEGWLEVEYNGKVTKPKYFTHAKKSKPGVELTEARTKES